MGKVSLATKQKNKRTPLEDTFAAQLCEAGFKGTYRRNARFIEGRRFEGDFVFPRLKIVAEVDGGEWLGRRGGHTSGRGYTSDRERDSLAYLDGWHTVRFAGGQVKDGTAIEMFKKVWEKRETELT